MRGQITKTGSGYGAGDGDGYGAGYGDGSGYGAGYGYGDGSGTKIDLTIAGYDTYIYLPWSVLRIGCEVHSCERWLSSWTTIAKSHNVEPTEELGAKIREICSNKY